MNLSILALLLPLGAIVLAAIIGLFQVAIFNRI
jgi:hypothetical protein